MIYVKGSDGKAKVVSSHLTDGELYYDKGKQDENDKFWDNIQNKGALTNYQYKFLYWDFDVAPLPKYDIKPTGQMQFITGYAKGDFAKWIKDSGIVFDTSNATGFGECFAYCPNLTHLPEISTIGVNNLSFVFYNCGAHTIDKVILREDGTQTFNRSGFQGNWNLENIVIEGVIGANNWDMKSSKRLSKASITSVINALSGTTSGLTVTFSKTAVNKAFETSSGAADGSTSQEWLDLIATKSNWTISLTEA